MKSLAERFKYARERAGLTQAAISREIGISRSAVSQIEDGTTKALKGSTLVAVERATGFSGEWINTGRGEMQAGPWPLPPGDADQINKILADLAKLPKRHRDKIEADIAFLASLNSKGDE